MIYKNLSTKARQATTIGLKAVINVIMINLHIAKTVAKVVDSDGEVVIDTLRGLHGKKAKLEMFRFFISTGKYTYEQLVEAFPYYQD